MNQFLRRGFLGLIAMLVATATLAQSDIYRYSLDLSRVNNDQLQVSLQPPVSFLRPTTTSTVCPSLVSEV